jgi:hypothetical protein
LGSNHRRLKAAQPRSIIGARSIEPTLRHDHELHYIDGTCLPELMSVLADR